MHTSKKVIQRANAPTTGAGNPSTAGKGGKKSVRSAVQNARKTYAGTTPAETDPANTANGIPADTANGTPAMPAVTTRAGITNGVDLDKLRQPAKEEFLYLNNKDLQISPDIQRNMKSMRVEEIVENYSPYVANPLKVSFRDGKYYIFDGMHTRMAMRSIMGTDDFPVFCRVYYGLSKEEEAYLFAAQFGFSEKVPKGFRLRALEVAKDPEVLDFLAVTRSTGFTIDLGSHASFNGNIAAVCTAFDAYRALGRTEYARMLRILHRTWAGESWSINKYMLGGMARFMKMNGVDEEIFVKGFRKVTYNDIYIMSLRFYAMTKDGATATALAEFYDSAVKAALKKGA